MRYRFEKRWDTIGVAVITLVAIAVFGHVLIRSVWLMPDDQNAPSSASQSASVALAATSSPQAAPVRILIPRLSINANVQHVGLSAKGNIGVPNNFTDVAWYKYSPPPGSPGTAILDGHVDNGLSLAGVFKHLGELIVGDEIDIRSASGTQLRFVVYDIESYPYQQVPVQSLLAPQPNSELVLITCEGAWVQGQRTYDHRLVIYAKLAA